jgi:hypothetical protein
MSTNKITHSKLKQLAARPLPSGEYRNIPFTHAEIAGWKKTIVGKGGTIVNEYENRFTRKNPNTQQPYQGKGTSYHGSRLDKFFGYGFRKDYSFSQEDKVYMGISCNPVPRSQRVYP